MKKEYDPSTYAQLKKGEIEQLSKKLETGIRNVFESDHYKKYLETMSKFHHYSVNNCLLIAMQRPDAQLVASYTDWNQKFQRTVSKGEHGIKIFAPAPYKTMVEKDVVDVNGRPIFDENGNIAKQQVERLVQSFKVATVFDISQTVALKENSVDLVTSPMKVEELTGSVHDYHVMKEIIESIAPVPVFYQDIPFGAKGYFDTFQNVIVVQRGLPEAQTIKTLIHEIEHSIVDNLQMPKADRETQEVRAESVAFIVCNHYGLDTSDYSFGYCASWSSGKDVKELKNELENIRKGANDIINKMDLELHRCSEQSKEKKIEMASLVHTKSR